LGEARDAEGRGEPVAGEVEVSDTAAGLEAERPAEAVAGEVEAKEGGGGRPEGARD